MRQTPTESASRRQRHSQKEHFMCIFSRFHPPKNRRRNFPEYYNLAFPAGIYIRHTRLLQDVLIRPRPILMGTGVLRSERPEHNRPRQRFVYRRVKQPCRSVRAARGNSISPRCRLTGSFQIAVDKNGSYRFYRPVPVENPRITRFF